MSFIGVTQFDASSLLAPIYYVLPGDVGSLVENFVQGLEQTRSGGLMSTALFFSVHNSANGFRAIIRNANTAYDSYPKRSGIKQVALSLAIMLLFASVLLVMLVLLVLGRYVWEIFMPNDLDILFTPLSAIGAFLIMAFATMMIFKLAAPKKLRLLQVLPGAALTVTAWAVASAVFGFVMTNFTQYPAIYGSIAGVFILILWLNLISLILLVGNELNALLVTEKRIYVTIAETKMKNKGICHE